MTLIDTACIISSSNPMFDHLLELSLFGEEIGIIEIKNCTLSGALYDYALNAC